jgi:3-hydroxybutyryl-CoA dehydrogenase
MKIFILSNSPVSSLFGKELPFDGTECLVKGEVPVNGLDEFDLLIDLTFEEDGFVPEYLKSLRAPVLIGSVIQTLKEFQDIQVPIARFNHWPTFINRNCIEFSTNNYAPQFEEIFMQLNIPYFKTEDIPGFVSAKTISMIINEAYFALQDEVSSKEEIDTAMKLGTNYPYGPFEWAAKIGEDKIVQLLLKLAESDTCYKPAQSFIKKSEIS